jgi:uncharacterized protein (TIGR03083 family)
MDRPTSKAELMTQLQASWDALQEAAASVDPTRMATPGPDGWSVKDQLAHVSAWERSLIALLTGESRAAAIGMDEAAYAAADIDQMNAYIVSQAADATYPEVLAQAQATHNELIGILDRLSWEEINQPYRHFQPDCQEEFGNNPALDWVLGNTTEHYPEHREYLERTVAVIG